MRRNRYFYLLIAVVILLPLLSLSCISTPATTPASAQSSPLTQVQERVNALEQKVNEKATTGSVSALETRMAQAEGKITTLQSTGPGNTYTKAEVDAAVAAAVAALKADQAWITGSSSSSSGSSTPITGQVTFTTNPTAIPQLFSSNTGSNQLFYTMRITNGVNQWQYVKPILTLNIASGYSSANITALTVSMSCGQCSMTGSGTIGNSTIGNFSISPAIGTILTSSTVIIPISGCTSGEFQIGAGQFLDVLIAIQVTTATTVLWNVSNSISSRGL